MAQHFLLSAGARSLSAAKIVRMSDDGVEDVFRRLRWPETDGKPVCPGCGCPICYACRRPAGQLRWRCKACRRDFSITSDTLFAWHKLPLRKDLLAVVVFCNEVRGKRHARPRPRLGRATQDGVRAWQGDRTGFSKRRDVTNPSSNGNPQPDRSHTPRFGYHRMIPDTRCPIQ